jgi:hypothetical protein
MAFAANDARKPSFQNSRSIQNREVCMIAVHRIFQMVFGVIVSLMLLYFLLNYTGGYKQTQEDFQKAEILKSFADEARSVYLTEIPTNFTHFSRYDFSSCFATFNDNDIPEIKCADSKVSVPIETPVIFYPGSQVFVARDALDYGWWTFGFAEAMPDLVFVFSPDSTDEAWGIMTGLVEHLPDTSDERSAVKVGFAFCDGSDILYPCGGRACDRGEFLSLLATGPSGSVSPCTANPAKNMRLAAITWSCNPQNGICIIPPNSKGVGNAFVEGYMGTFVYKDPLDLAALAIGGTGKDDFGKTGAEKLYAYKNSILMQRLPMAAKVMSRRFQLTANDVTQECGDIYIELSQVLGAIPDSPNYSDLGMMYDLNDRLNEAKELYQRLADSGCERSRE